jgi:hypothetical protein
MGSTHFFEIVLVCLNVLHTLHSNLLVVALRREHLKVKNKNKSVLLDHLTTTTINFCVARHMSQRISIYESLKALPAQPRL